MTEWRYRRQKLEGWSLAIREELFAEQSEALATTLGLLRDQLRQVQKVVPKEAVKFLKTVPLWLSPEYAGTGPRAEYHPGADWLRDNGRDPAMVKGVEFTNIRIFPQECRRMPVFALHELAHAYHDQVLGFAHPDVKAAYEQAVRSGTYESVPRNDGTKARHYGLTNEREYFAEATEAFFGTNDFYPFHRSDLHRHDPACEVLLQKLWKTR